MRILLITQWFDPEPTVKGLPFARALARAGHEVQVITGFPNYPGGKVYPGYRIRPWTREVHDEVRVTRVALYPSHGNSAIGRVLNYVSFAATATIAGICSRFQPDVIYVYHPPLTTGLAGAAIGLVRRAPFVYDIQDLWPDTLSATGMIRSEALLGLVGRVANFVYRRASMIVAQSPGFVTRLIERGVSPTKARLVYNWCDEAALSERADKPGVDLASFRGRLNVVFAGTMGKAQALDAVLVAAQLVREEDERVQFVFVGGGTEVSRLQDVVREKNITNVIFLGRLAMSEMGHVFDHADALLVHLRDSALFAITVPSKTQAYLFAAKPIIMAVPGDAAELVKEAEAGPCIRSEDPSALANAVLAIARLSPQERASMGTRGRAYYDRVLSLDQGTVLMLDAFRAAIAAHQHPDNV